LNNGYAKIAETSGASCRAGFRHGQEGQLPRAPTKRRAPTNEGPRAKADSNKDPPDKRASMRWVWTPLSGGFLEWGPLEWDPIE
jgi:hypothetical protein